MLLTVGRSMQEEIERMIASLSEAAPENTANKQASDTVQTKIKDKRTFF